MQNLLIYGGISINIFGALMVIFFAIRYYTEYKHVNQMPQHMVELKSRWHKQRAYGWGILMAGTVIALLGCVV